MNNKHERTAATTTGGVGFGALLTLAFIILKLSGVISWSWVWVLSPIWIGVGIILIFGFIIPAILILVTLIRDKRKEKKNEKDEIIYDRTIPRTPKRRDNFRV